MKPVSIFILIGLLFCSYPLMSQLIDWQSVIDDFELKYTPQTLPEWFFPIIFENSELERDTVYFSYHEDSHIWMGFDQDTTFGEKFFSIDS